MLNIKLEEHLNIILNTDHMAIIENPAEKDTWMAVVEIGDDGEPIGDHPEDHQWVAYQCNYAVDNLSILSVIPLNHIVNILGPDIAEGAEPSDNE